LKESDNISNDGRDTREESVVKQDGQDQFLEEVDQELRLIKTRLKKVFSETEALLKEYSEVTEESSESDETETK
jgi:hypothetical protein